jgi:hypothetical protein
MSDRNPASLPATNSLVLGAMEDRTRANRNGPLSQIFFVETEPFSDPTLQTWDAWWSRRIKVLEQGFIDPDEFETIVPPWRNVPKEAPFNLLGQDESKSASLSRVLAGDFVLIRSGTQIRVLVVAGRGRFWLEEEAVGWQTFFHYPFMWSRRNPKDGCKTLQLNTFPPRLTLELAAVIQKNSRRHKALMPLTAFSNGWLKPNAAPSKTLPLLGGCYLRLAPWQKASSGMQYCVVRLRPSIFCYGEKARGVEEDLRYAILAAREAALFLRQHPRAVLAFRDAFGVNEPSQMHHNTVARVYEGFVGHMVKAVILEAAVDRDIISHAPPPISNSSAGEKSSVRLAFVKGRERTVIYLEPAYFKLSPNRRAATLIHEFCHAWGMAGHPGTGGYGGKVQSAVVRDWLETEGYPAIRSLNDPHPMVQLTERGTVRAIGLLPWIDTRTQKPMACENPYCYGYFISWNHGNFWRR